MRKTLKLLGHNGGKHAHIIIVLHVHVMVQSFRCSTHSTDSTDNLSKQPRKELEFQIF